MFKSFTPRASYETDNKLSVVIAIRPIHIKHSVKYDVLKHNLNVISSKNYNSQSSAIY